jgi:hypothetical protein
MFASYRELRAPGVPLSGGMGKAVVRAARLK